MRQGQTTTPGITCPTIFDNHVTLKIQATAPTVYMLYPRRPERITIADEITKSARSTQLF